MSDRPSMGCIHTHTMSNINQTNTPSLTWTPLLVLLRYPSFCVNGPLRAEEDPQQALWLYQHPSILTRWLTFRQRCWWRSHHHLPGPWQWSGDSPIPSQGTCDNVTLALSIWLYFGGWWCEWGCSHVMPPKFSRCKRFSWLHSGTDWNIWYSKNRPIIPSIACLAQFIAWHRVVFGWPSVLATLFNWLSKEPSVCLKHSSYGSQLTQEWF